MYCVNAKKVKSSLEKLCFILFTMACIFQNSKLHSFIPLLKSSVPCLRSKVQNKGFEFVLLLNPVLTTHGHKNRLFSVLILNKTFSGYSGILREVK